MANLADTIRAAMEAEPMSFKREMYANMLRKMGEPLQVSPKPRQFGSLDEMMAALAEQRRQQAAAKPKPVDPKKRIPEIEAELDILRGVVPTPPGYNVDPGKVKSLMAELKQLKAQHG